MQPVWNFIREHLSALEGALAMGLAGAAHTWALVYPWVTGTTALCGCILAVHGVVNLLRGRLLQVEVPEAPEHHHETE